MPMPAMAAGMNRSFIVRTLSLLPVYLTLQSDSEFDLEFGQNDIFMQAGNSIDVILYVDATPIETRS